MTAKDNRGIGIALLIVGALLLLGQFVNLGAFAWLSLAFVHHHRAWRLAPRLGLYG